MTKEQFIALGLTEEQAKKASEASQEELKTYIPKHRFDEVNEENKTLKNTAKENADQLETLKKSAGDNAELQKQIQTLQDEVKKKDEESQAALKDMKITNAIKLAIAGKVHDEELASSLFDKSKLILSDDGKVTGLEEQLKTLSESKKFLFKEDTTTKPETKPGFKIGSDGKPAEQQTTRSTSLFSAVTAHLNQQSTQ